MSAIDRPKVKSEQVTPPTAAGARGGRAEGAGRAVAMIALNNFMKPGTPYASKSPGFPLCAQSGRFDSYDILNTVSSLTQHMETDRNGKIYDI